MTVLAVIMVGVLTNQNYQQTLEKKKESQDRIEELQKAIETYAAVFGHYSCPSDPTLTEASAGFGVEADTATGCDDTAGLFVYEDTPPDPVLGRVVMGGVPVRTINTPFSNSYDSYGNRIMYAVTENLTYTLAANGHIRILRAYDPAVKVGNHTSDMFSTENAIYVLLSYGEDGVGAYGHNATTRNNPMAQGAGIVDSDEQNVNHDMNRYTADPGTAPTFDNIFLSSWKPLANHFDDSLTWAAKKIEPCKGVGTPWVQLPLPYTTGLVAWLDGAEEKTLINNNGIAIADGDSFATWCDKSASAASSSLPAFAYGKDVIARPARVRDSIISGKTAVRFSSLDTASEDPDGMLIDDSLNITGGDFTAFIVSKHNAGAKGITLETREAATWWLGLNNTNHGFGAGGLSETAPESDLVWMDTLVKKGAGYDYYSNGAVVSTNNLSTVYPGRLGLLTGGISNLPSDTDIAEIIIFDNDIGIANIDATEQYLDTKWNICAAHGEEWLPAGECGIPCPNNQIPDGSGGCTCPSSLPNLGTDGVCYASCGSSYFYGTSCHTCQQGYFYGFVGAYWGLGCKPNCPSGQDWYTQKTGGGHIYSCIGPGEIAGWCVDNPMAFILPPTTSLNGYCSCLSGYSKVNYSSREHACRHN